MANAQGFFPSADFREELARRGGASAARCFQCATCTSVCQLATSDVMFPRRQMLKAQWGLGDALAADPAVWLCHRCNDCNVRCPRDAKPGDVMQVIRSLTIEKLAAPAFMGRFVANAASTWPFLLGIPLLFWIVALALVNGLHAPPGMKEYAEVVPLWLIYVVFFSVSGLAALSVFISGKRFWDLMGSTGKRTGSFFSHLMPVLIEIATHKRFASCDAARSRRWGHFTLLWGFVGAAVTSGFIVLALYVLKSEMPLPLLHPFKLLGNLSAVFLVVGGAIILYNRAFTQDKNAAGASTAFDNFFLAVVVLLIATGVVTEAARFWLPPSLAYGIYILHLTAVLCLFATFPFSKFAHMVYRALAMVHERMIRQENAN